MSTVEDKNQILEIKNGPLSARICRYGASVMSLSVVDSAGNSRDIVLGFDKPEDYLERNSPYFGCVVGRVANRIADARFVLDAVTYNLPANHGPNTLHGGPAGLHKHLWEVDEGSRTDTSVTLTTSSPDGDQGFPGSTEFTVKYSLPSSTELLIDMEGRTLEKRTPISLAHHMYWNLGGHEQGSILDHQLRLNSESYTPVGPSLIPTGEILPTSGTPFDFSTTAAIGSRIDAVDGGYDHNYVVQRDNDGSATVKVVAGERVFPVATVKCPESGISLTLHASAPGVQFYSGNFLDGTVTGKGRVQYQKHSGFCLETQSFPNAVNEPKFPQVIVRPGQPYRQVMHIEFGH